MELKSVCLEVPEGANVIFGQSHFIKTIEDLYEVVVNTVPQSRFGLAFCEASGACLIRLEGNDEELKKVACRNAEAIGAGHTFVMILQEAYPINILNAIKDCAEVCSIFCATANPVEVIVAETAQGRGVLGVIDGSAPKGVEGPTDVQWRKNLLRKIGYKIS
jgi:adenosine/AMP kinase